MKAQGLRQHSNTLDNIKSSKNLNFLICDSIQIPFTFKLSSYLHFSSLETDSSGHMIIIILQSALKKRPCQYEDTCDMPKYLNIPNQHNSTFDILAIYPPCVSNGKGQQKYSSPSFKSPLHTSLSKHKITLQQDLQLILCDLLKTYLYSRKQNVS